MVVHAASLARSGATRSDPAIAFWSLPWTAIRILGHPFSRPRGIFAFAWKARFIIVGLTIYQFTTTGPPTTGPAFGGVITVLLVLSYAAPRWSRSWRSRLTAAGDRAVVEHNLGPAMATYLRRSPVTQDRANRIQLLESPIPQPGLGLAST